MKHIAHKGSLIGIFHGIEECGCLEEALSISCLSFAGYIHDHIAVVVLVHIHCALALSFTVIGIIISLAFTTLALAVIGIISLAFTTLAFAIGLCCLDSLGTHSFSFTLAIRSTLAVAFTLAGVSVSLSFRSTLAVTFTLAIRSTLAVTFTLAIRSTFTLAVVSTLATRRRSSLATTTTFTLSFRSTLGHTDTDFAIVICGTMRGLYGCIGGMRDGCIGGMMRGVDGCIRGMIGERWRIHALALGIHALGIHSLGHALALGGSSSCGGVVGDITVHHHTLAGHSFTFTLASRSHGTTLSFALTFTFG